MNVEIAKLQIFLRKRGWHTCKFFLKAFLVYIFLYILHNTPSPPPVLRGFLQFLHFYIVLSITTCTNSRILKIVNFGFAIFLHPWPIFYIRKKALKKESLNFKVPDPPARGCGYCLYGTIPAAQRASLFFLSDSHSSLAALSLAYAIDPIYILVPDEIRVL